MAIPDWKKGIDIIRTILLSEWDPIGFGFGVPDDEYDAYLPTIYSHIHRNASIQEIAQLLEKIETESMGLAARPSVNLHVAQLLVNQIKTNHE